MECRFLGDSIRHLDGRLVLNLRPLLCRVPDGDRHDHPCNDLQTNLVLSALGVFLLASHPRGGDCGDGHPDEQSHILHYDGYHVDLSEV